MDTRKGKNSKKVSIVPEAENIPPIRSSEDEKMEWTNPLWVRDDARASLMEKIAHGDRIKCVRF